MSEGVQVGLRMLCIGYYHVVQDLELPGKKKLFLFGYIAYTCGFRLIDFLPRPYVLLLLPALYLLPLFRSFEAWGGLYDVWWL